MKENNNYRSYGRHLLQSYRKMDISAHHHTPPEMIKDDNEARDVTPTSEPSTLNE